MPLTRYEIRCLKNGLHHAQQELAEAIKTLREGGEAVAAERLKTLFVALSHEIAAIEDKQPSGPPMDGH